MDTGERIKFRVLMWILCVLFFPESGYTQAIKTTENKLSVDFMQIEESLNYGLVFTGQGIGYDYSIQWENPKRIINYSAGIGFNFLQTRKIAAANLHLSPVRFSWLFKSRTDGSFAIGPYFIADYNYQVYPDLQSGYSFWFTHLSIGGSMQYSFKIKQEAFKVLAETRLTGVTSRPIKYVDPYFFDLDVGYVLRSVNRDYNLGSLYDYNHSKVELRWQNKPDSRLAFSYTFVYRGYFNEPQFTMIDHRLSIIFLPKSSL